MKRYKQNTDVMIKRKMLSEDNDDFIISKTKIKKTKKVTFNEKVIIIEYKNGDII